MIQVWENGRSRYAKNRELVQAHDAPPRPPTNPVKHLAFGAGWTPASLEPANQAIPVRIFSRFKLRNAASGLLAEDKGGISARNARFRELSTTKQRSSQINRSQTPVQRDDHLLCLYDHERALLNKAVETWCECLNFKLMFDLRGSPWRASGDGPVLARQCPAGTPSW